MQLRPATLRSTWTGGGAVALDTAAAKTTCRQCQLPLAGWQVDFIDDGPTCPLCGLTVTLNRPAIDSEAVLIWLPQLTQRAIVPLVRAAHLSLHRADLSADTLRPPNRLVPEEALGAITALAALRACARQAEERIGTTSPRVLGAAVLEIGRETPDAALGGLRVLPLGRVIEDGVDIYPEILAAWAATDKET